MLGCGITAGRNEMSDRKEQELVCKMFLEYEPILVPARPDQRTGGKVNSRHDPTKWQQLGELLLASLGLGCRHPHKTWPLSYWIGPRWARRRVTVQTCTECGRVLQYNGELRHN